MTRDYTMRRILPVLMALLITSCNSTQKAPATKEQSALCDQRFEEAVEYYTLQHESRPAVATLREKQEDGSLSESEEGILRRIRHLRESLLGWGRDESRESIVDAKDCRDVYRIVDDALRNPPSDRWLFAPADRASSVRTSVSFLCGNRCHVCLLSHDNGPMAQAGLDVFLIKIKGKWGAIYWQDWIS